MTYSSGNTDMDSLIDKLADDLIATGSWQDADVAGRPALATPARRAVEHIVDGFFVSLERVVTSPYTNNKFNEIRVDVSSGYDTGTSSPSGTIETTGIPAEAWSLSSSYGGAYYWAGGGSVGSGNKAGQFWLWLDAEGFTVLTTWNPGSGYDYTSFLTVERNTTKEYADGYTNFFVAAWTNADPTIVGNNGSTYYSRYFATGYTYDLGRKEYIRPFNVSDVARDNGLEGFEPAYRSDGNSKVYFQFPYYSNNLDTAKRTPIAQTKRWFDVALGQGLADGDLVDWVDGAQTKTYLVKTLQSPDSAAYLTVALRQA